MKKLRFTLILAFIILLICPSFLQTTNHIVKAQEQNYTIDGDTVYIDDSRVYIATTPHTSSGGWVYLNLTSKQYSGEVDLAFGYDSSVAQPRSLDIWSSKVDSYRIPDRYFDNTTFYMYNYTAESVSVPNAYNGTIYLWTKITYNQGEPENSTQQIVVEDWLPEHSRKFDQANLITRTIYWQVNYWKSIANQNFNSVNYEYNGMNRWVYTAFNAVAGKEYFARIWLDVTPSLDGTLSKYFVAVKRSSDSIQEAISNDRFYALDPWYGSSWIYRKSHTITGSSVGMQTDYQVGIKVYYGSGTDGTESLAGATFGKVYTDSNCKTDFGDIRFTKADGITPLDYWIDYKVNGNYAIIWVEVDTIPESPSTIDIYMYYGNDAASTTSNGENTFAFFDNFNDNSLDGAKWTSFGPNNVLETNQQWETEDSSDNGGHYTQSTSGDGRYLFYFQSTGDGNTYPSIHYMCLSNSANWPFTGYRLLINMFGNDITFEEVDNGDITDLWTSGSPGDYATSTMYRVVITFENGDINGSITELDGIVEDTFSVSDSTHTSGYYGVRAEAYSASVGIYDNPFIAKFVDPEPTHTSWGSEEGEEVVPTITAASITNMDNTDDLLPMYKWYEFKVVTDDEDGFEGISKVYLRGKEGAGTIFEVRGVSLESTPSWSIQTGASIIDLDPTSCLWETSGTQGNATFKIRIEYDHPQYQNMELDAYVEDMSTDNSGWVNAQTDYFDVIINLVTTFNLDDTRGNLTQEVTAIGNVTFEGSSLYPSDSNFTSVSVYDSGDNNKGTDNTILDGQWEITFNTPGTVGTETYNLYINMVNADYPDGEETSPTETFINDRYNVTQFWASNYNPHTGENITLYTIFESEYDSHICDGDDAITIEDLVFTYDPIEEYYFTEIGKDETGTYYFDTLNSIYEHTYGVHDGNLDYNLSITWGYIQYDLYGLFYENGTYAGNVTVNMHFTDDLDSFTLEQFIEKNYEDRPIMISWGLTGGGARRIYLTSDNETHYIFTPFDDYISYSFSIKDYSGVIGSGNAYLESYLIINGTERLIERASIRDTLNPTSLLLQKDLTYRIQIRIVGGTVYDQGYFTPSIDTTPILVIEEVEWGDQIHYVGQYITIEFSRPDPEHIQTNYKDILEDTTSIFLEICYTNGTQIWNTTSTEQMIQFNWYDAINTTDYLAKITAQHGTFGEVTHQAWLPGETEGFPDLPDFDIIGTGATKALAILLIFSAFILTSRLNGYMGIFLATAVAYIVRYVGFLPELPYLVMHVVMTLTIMSWLAGGNN